MHDKPKDNHFHGHFDDKHNQESEVKIVKNLVTFGIDVDRILCGHENATNQDAGKHKLIVKGDVDDFVAQDAELVVRGKDVHRAVRRD